MSKSCCLGRVEEMLTWKGEGLVAWCFGMGEV